MCVLHYAIPFIIQDFRDSQCVSSWFGWIQFSAVGEWPSNFLKELLFECFRIKVCSSENGLFKMLEEQPPSKQQFSNKELKKELTSANKKSFLVDVFTDY